MSLDETQISNKMIQTPPAKKGWHFAGDGTHFAEFIEAETIEEATAIYHKTKRLLFPSVEVAHPGEIEQSPVPAETMEEANG